MKIVKPMTLGVMHRPYRWRGKHRLLVATLSFFDLGGRVQYLLRDNLQWRKVMASLPAGKPLDELMPKARGEALVAGSAYAAHGIATTEQRVRLQVGAIDKSLRVLGDREWLYGMLPFFSVTEPKPFTSMPLTWDRAYGGARHPANPEGRGYTPSPVRAWVGRNHGVMPNIEDPRMPVRGLRRRYAPAGFGQLDVGWMPRSQWIGTYGKAWQSEPYPGLADDTHPEFFNAAPLDQRLPGFFEGGETYQLEGMHPERAMIEGQLPEFRPRAFVHRAGHPADAVDEVSLSFDTVWFFPDVSLGVAIHRGEVDVDDSLAMDVEALMVAYEHAGDAPRSFAHYGQVLALRMNRDTAARHVFNESQLTPEPDASVRATRLEEDQAERKRREAAHVVRHAAIAAELEAESGIPAAPAPPMPDLPLPGEAAIARGDFDMGALLDAAQAVADKASADADALRKQSADDLASVTQAAASDPMTVDEALARAQGNGGAMPSLAEFSTMFDVPAASIEQLHDLQRRGRLASPAPETPLPALAPEVAAAVGQWVLSRVRQGASLYGCDLAGANLRGAMLSGADLRGALLEASDLSDAQLDGADLSEVALAGATLDRANCAAARFDGANLGRTLARRTSFRGAIFTNTQASDANWSDADLTGARFDQCVAPNIVLDRANCEQTTLNDCVFLHARAQGSRWARSQWQRTVALGSQLADTDWQEASLTRCVLMESRLTDSVWTGATLTRVQGGGGADWARADLRRVRAEKSSWRDASVADANLSEGQFRECDFSGTTLTHALMERTLFYRSLFMGGVLTACHAQSADFYQAMCRRADFRSANLRDANFVQAECTEALFAEACLDGVRLEPGRRLRV
ncbi:uncharacterized protein YjbI with pentapeptide repeats [Luteibacter sp. Sphag1AF]|uniref:DUF2169 family type VI secretion system accessory protein n=1 Tax=Luteibacter sp. Sphag1AF TaxID=2587031 RepID=UPI001610448D|nr:DUF2169 domain-containing protein [Luteibacter sp. Sphag1AF]MBB3228069.1 uncharacterized protein YjbI with pentapeptide repeats [Luteibacter sp. Sphag1AF]